MPTVWTCSNCGIPTTTETATPPRQCTACGSLAAPSESQGAPSSATFHARPVPPSGGASIVSFALDPDCAVRLTRGHAKLIYWLVCGMLALALLSLIITMGPLLQYGGGGTFLVSLITWGASAFGGLVGVRLMLESAIRSNEAIELLAEFRYRG